MKEYSDILFKKMANGEKKGKKTNNPIFLQNAFIQDNREDKEKESMQIKRGNML